MYIIRHGESEGNALGILQGRNEFPLTSKGRSQAMEWGHVLRDMFVSGVVGKTLFYASPQKRTRETVAIITGQVNLPDPVFDEDLVEMDLGVWTGKTRDEVKAANEGLWNALWPAVGTRFLAPNFPRPCTPGLCGYGENPG